MFKFLKRVFWIFVVVAVLFVLFLGLAYVTRHWRARHFGGKIDVELQVGRKLVNATWKDESLWYLTRPARPGETPEVWVFQEDSKLEIAKGAVTFHEK